MSSTRSGRRRRTARALWFFPVPALALYLFFFVYPVLQAVQYSLTDWDGIRVRRFLGLRNFTDLFEDYVFLDGLRNMVVYTTLRVVLLMLFAFVAAEFVVSFRSERARTFWKILFVIPIVVPVAVTYLLWGFIFNPQNGMLNMLLTSIGLSDWALPWLGTSATAGTPAEFAAYIAVQHKKWVEVGKAAGVKLN